MSSTGSAILEQLSAARDGLRALPTDVSALREWDDATLLAAIDLHTEAARSLGAVGAALAGEVAFRSRPALGSGGLARRTGHRTPENLIKSVTGATKEQVLTVVEAGTLLAELADEGKVDQLTGEVCAPSKPWLRDVAVAVASGAISTSASGAIGRALGVPNSAVTAEQLRVAAVTLVAHAVAGVDSDKLWRIARDLRNEVDLAGVKLRERELFDARGLTHFPLAAGGGRAIWDMDTDTYATFVDFYDRSTSPKRGGVRFVDPARAEKARKIEDDPRSFKQKASDDLIHFLKLGADADPNVMLGSGAPTIRITVAEKALETGVGFGRVDGQAAPVSIDTVKRMMENGKILRVGFDPGGRYIEQVEDPLAENRLYNRKQREILAAKFGGCMDPTCDRPPSWTEAHHIRWVVRDRGKTTIENAILLCKYHHLQYHNEGYEITQDIFGNYWKVPPASVDPGRNPIAMQLKTRNLKDMWDADQRAAG
jgi:hypothetical protein